MVDPAVKITAMILMAIMSLATLGVCVYSVKKESNDPGGLWWMLAIATGAGTIVLWVGIGKLTGINFDG